MTPAAKAKPAAKAAAKKTTAKKATTAGKGTATPTKRASAGGAKATAKAPREAATARAIQRTTRQSPYKMRLVIDQIRGKSVNDALALLTFSKKGAAKQIEKVLRSAVANVEYQAREKSTGAVDVDALYVTHAVINEGPKLKRFMPAAMGRATPIQKRTSHVEIVVTERNAR